MVFFFCVFSFVEVLFVFDKSDFLSPAPHGLSIGTGGQWEGGWWEGTRCVQCGGENELEGR